MYNDLYPPTKVNWYPDAAASLQRSNTDGLSYPDFAHGGKPASPSGGTFAAVQGYLSSEYGRPNKAVQCPSFFSAAASEGLPPTSPPAVASLPAPTVAHDDNGVLIVNVDSALDLQPSDRFGVHYYYATAHYLSEPEVEVASRRTVSVKARPVKDSSADSLQENCVLHKRIAVPYNSRQQFVMVDILEEDQLGDTFIGQATLPLADERLASTAPWPLIRDGIQNGVVTLNVQLPSSDQPSNAGGAAMASTSAFGFGAAVSSSAGVHDPLSRSLPPSPTSTRGKHMLPGSPYGPPPRSISNGRDDSGMMGTPPPPPMGFQPSPMQPQAPPMSHHGSPRAAPPMSQHGSLTAAPPSYHGSPSGPPGYPSSGISGFMPFSPSWFQSQAPTTMPFGQQGGYSTSRSWVPPSSLPTPPPAMNPLMGSFRPGMSCQTYAPPPLPGLAQLPQMGMGAAHSLSYAGQHSRRESAQAGAGGGLNASYPSGATAPGNVHNFGATGSTPPRLFSIAQGSQPNAQSTYGSLFNASSALATSRPFGATAPASSMSGIGPMVGAAVSAPLPLPSTLYSGHSIGPGAHTLYGAAASRPSASQTLSSSTRSLEPGSGRSTFGGMSSVIGNGTMGAPHYEQASGNGAFGASAYTSYTGAGHIGQVSHAGQISQGYLGPTNQLGQQAYISHLSQAGRGMQGWAA